MKLKWVKVEPGMYESTNGEYLIWRVIKKTDPPYPESYIFWHLGVKGDDGKFHSIKMIEPKDARNMQPSDRSNENGPWLLYTSQAKTHLKDLADEHAKEQATKKTERFEGIKLYQP